MLLFVVLAILLPWSIYRQMNEHQVTREGLIKIPLIFLAIGLLFGGIGHLTGPAAIAALLGSIAVSVLFGVARGAVMPVWRDGEDRWMTRGNRLTLTLWVALIAFKFAVGAVASITGWFPVETATEVFLVLGVSFTVQNMIVARRSISRRSVASREREVVAGA
jgi:hypothetical protein